MFSKQNSSHENFWLLFAIAVMIILTLVREVAFFPILDMLPNPDSSWLLHAAQRVADGQRLYVDIMETNPPLIVWLNLLPVWVAGLFGISPFLVFPFLVTLLNIGSLWLVAGEMRKNKLLSEKVVFQVVLLYIAFGFFMLSPAIYGQRELLFISLVLPYLIESLDEDEGVKKLSVRRLIVIIMAAVGFAIKPFFMLLWGVNELHLAVNRRKFNSIFSLTNWLIGLSQLVYFAMIYYFTPEYITAIIPTVLSTYFTYETTWFVIGKMISIVAGTAVFLVLLARPHGDYKKFVGRILVWMLACTALMLLQRKEWLNHLYPMVFMAGFVVVIVWLYFAYLWHELGLLIGHLRFTLFCVSTALLLVCGYIDAQFWYSIYQPSVIHGKLLTEINNRATGKYVYPLAFNMQSGFPVIALSKGVFRGSFQQLWPMSGLIIREQQGVSSPEIIKARQFFYDTLVHDFYNHPPELVWVDENVNLEKIADYDIEPENRNIIAVLSRDVRFAILWQNYEKVGEVEGSLPEEKENIKDEKALKPERYSLYTWIKK